MLAPTFEIDQLDEHLARARADRPIGHFSLTCLDDLIGGIRAGRMTILSGEPGVAKTTLVGQLADEAAANGFTVVLNTLEVAPYQLIAKSIARLSNGEISVADVAGESCIEIIREAAESYRRTIAPRICIIDKPFSAIDLGAIIGHLQRENDYPVILFYDYLQIMPSASEQGFMDERLAVKESVAGLRRIANAHDVPVFAVSSVNRSTYGKATANLDCLGQSSSVEYGADTVLYMSVEGKGEERTANMSLPRRPIVLTALKNRYAPTGSVKLAFDAEHAMFYGRA